MAEPAQVPPGTVPASAGEPSTRAGTPRLLGDIGGTNARFAWQTAEGAPLSDMVSLPSAEHASLADAMRAYLSQTGHAVPPSCAFGIANPVTGDEVRMTNHPWSFSIAALQRALGFERLVVLNDFTALALALPALAEDEKRRVGGGEPVADAAIAVLGPGTGLGMSGLLPTAGPGGWIPLRGEGGHTTLAATNDREAAVIALLRDDFGHVSAERALSGRGLEALHSAVCRLDRVEGTPALSAAEISDRGLAETDGSCVEALGLFCSFLGCVAGNLALTLGARGGVYLGGGIVPRLGAAFERSSFRASFEAKGRFRTYLEAIPVYVIEAKVSPALLGASRALLGRA